jgi:hypothetical protein
VDATELLRHVTAACDRLGLVYLVTGSTATSVYGEPRFTNDLDIVIDLASNQIKDFLAEFPPADFYYSKQVAEEAVARCGQFNLIHPGSGLKVDVIVASQSPFDRERLRRARPLTAVADRLVAFASPEDVVLKKMEYFREGRSEKHLRDIAGVLRVQRDAIDRDYIARWAKQLDLLEVWNLVQAQEGV